MGLRYRVDWTIPGTRRRADIAFTGARVAVFVDGCFWHGCPEHATWPKRHAEWWRAKIEANRARDRDTNERLQQAGWTVLRFWEHTDPLTAARIVADTVAEERARGPQYRWEQFTRTFRDGAEHDQRDGGGGTGAGGHRARGRRR